MKSKLFVVALALFLLLAGCSSQGDATELTAQQAQQIALDHAGVTADRVSLLHAERDDEHGQPCYEVEFDWDGWEYTYDIHRQTGQVLDWDKDWD